MILSIKLLIMNLSIVKQQFKIIIEKNIIKKNI